ncbi:MAG: 3-keto-disaccharide hydrolase, partial [Gemmataceae bacterium]
GVYEIQLRDTAEKKPPLNGDDCGGIYPRAEERPKYHHIDDGIGPKVNAAKPAGVWQTLDVRFRAPRFDPKGTKTENAKIVIAKLNGTIIHENVELKTPTGGNWKKKENASGPFMLQADHGPVAFRNVRVQPPQ